MCKKIYLKSREINGDHYDLKYKGKRYRCNIFVEYQLMDGHGPVEHIPLKHQPKEEHKKNNKRIDEYYQ